MAVSILVEALYLYDFDSVSLLTYSMKISKELGLDLNLVESYKLGKMLFRERFVSDINFSKHVPSSSSNDSTFLFHISARVNAQMKKNLKYFVQTEISQESEEHVPSAPILSVVSDSEDTCTASEGVDEQKICAQHIADLAKSIPVMNTEKSVKAIMRMIKIDEEEINAIEVQTRGQRNCSVWHQQRKGRLTSSLFGRIVHCKTAQQSITSEVLGEKEVFQTQAMKWGIEKEKDAVKCFIDRMKDEHENFQYSATGFRIDQDSPYIGASPDGLVNCDCCTTAVVEVKCPESVKDLMVKDIKKKNFFLDENGLLKPSHNYYHQVQGQMGIFDCQRCFFVVFTNKDCNIQIISFDENYWSFMKSVLKSFFERNVLPRIVNSYK